LQGRLLLAAVSGRVLARSFQSVLNVGNEVIEQSLGGRNAQMPESLPQMTWSRMELSVMLEHVQAHVAPTDVDLGAGVQWLPKIRKSSPKVKRTGALLERVFMPCDMFFRYTRHKSGSPDLKVCSVQDSDDYRLWQTHFSIAFVLFVTFSSCRLILAYIVL